MGWRFNKTFGKQVRVNVSTSGVSVGTSVPGTGISYNTGIFRWGFGRSGGKASWLGMLGRLALVLALAAGVWYFSSYFGKKPKHAVAQKTGASIPLTNEKSPSSAFGGDSDEASNNDLQLPLPLPRYAVSKTNPQYVRAMIKPGQYTQSQIGQLARQLQRKLGGNEIQIDFFPTTRPLDWAGGSKLTEHLKTILICHVTISDDGTVEYAPGEQQGNVPATK